MAHRNNNKLPNNLPQLQNLIKRDSESYKDEFLQQHRHYQSTLQIFRLKPSLSNDTLSNLIMFLAQVSDCYKVDLENFPQELHDLLQNHATVLHPDMRMILCKALILLRNKGHISATVVLELFFGLFRCKDKLLRKTLFNYIVQDIKNVNSKHKNAKLNATLQNFMYTMLRDNNAIAAKMSLDVMIELYRRNIWHDAKTVNVIITALFSKVTKANKKTAKELLVQHKISKTTRKKQKKLSRALRLLKVVESVLMTIANNFITERNASEVMAVGLNAVREICNRCPLALGEDLLQDLVMYKTHKDKGVLMAARSLMQLYREKNPALLHKKDRGRPNEAMKEFKPLQYGESGAIDYLPGAEVLKTTDERDEHGKDHEEWESCSEDDDDSDGSWIDVHHSSDEELPEETDIPSDPTEKIQKAKEVTQSRILTQEEFKQLHLRQLAKKLSTDKGKKRKSDVFEEEDEEPSGEVISLSRIVNVYKKRRHDKEARMETVLASREGREKYTHRDRRQNPNASTTNKEKKKKKSFMMIKHKVARTKKKSFQEKQLNETTYFYLLLNTERPEEKSFEEAEAQKIKKGNDYSVDRPFDGLL
ncbi:hypothetical protein LSH36_55g08041 [Paralvinella palmiformis]|uniref:Protein SDA1 n=1 Tax=Paralvinella palmiformis TaxID=53620 RepID=A0AAD9K574_9ANNE|nr:hypothetical protein LSH36_55g08041 [Paralvinella palmiformis]